jgi:hypothetical protein
MRTNINRNTLITVLANRQDWIVVAAADKVHSVAVALPLSGQLLQVLAGYLGAFKRATKPATAGAARAAETTNSQVISITRGLSRCCHTPSVMPHHAVVRVRS